jgi:hypothetical protein
VKVHRHRRPIRLVAGLVVTVLSVPLLVAGGPAAVAAGCGSDESRWPEAPGEVQGLTFLGTVVEVGEATSDEGPRAWFRVDEVFDGAADSTIVVVPRCVGTSFVPGRTYLISTNDTQTLPGSDRSLPAAAEGEATFRDPTAVAWWVALGRKVSLLGYDGPSLATAPAWLREPRTVDEAVRALLPDGPSVTHERLGHRLSDDTQARIELLRTTLAPGAAMPPTRFAGDWLVRAEQGVLTLTLVEGSAQVGDAEGIDLDPGVPVNLGEGRVLLAGPDAVLTWENRGTEPVRLLSTASIGGDRPAMSEVDPDGPDDPADSGPVKRRHVITGRTASGDRSRITVKDRSGRIVGARFPTAREMRFAGPGWPSPDLRVTVGPVASVGRNRSEILLRSGTTPCGPVVTLDVARDLSAIKVMDHTPGCDAAGVPYAVVLRVRGDVPDAAGIHLSWERGR